MSTVQVLKNKCGDGWYCYFKSGNLEELLRSHEIYVDATQCPNLKVDYKKEEKNKFTKKRPLGGSTDSEHKRLKVALDNNEAENRANKLHAEEPLLQLVRGGFCVP